MPDSDQTNRFYLEPLAPGRYEIQVVHNAAIVASQVVEIGRGGRAPLSVEIQVEPAASS